MKPVPSRTARALSRAVNEERKDAALAPELCDVSFPGQRFVTIHQCAKALDCDPRTILAHVESGQLQAVNISTSPRGRPCYRIPRDAWLEWLAERQT